MDRINKNNFEAYFLDYHEDSLSAEEKQDVLDFLRENPDLYDSFQDFENILLPVEEFTYPHKTDLFRSDIAVPEADDWEYRCIAYMEGDLNEDEQKAFEKELKEDAEKEKVYSLYLATRSTPDTNIVFENKSGLKRKVVLIPRWMYGAVSAAAILVLAWFVFSPFNDGKNSPSLAEQENRDAVYIDKIAHPKKFDKIASVNIGQKDLREKVRPVQSEGSFESLLLAEEEFAREPILMAAINGKDFTQKIRTSTFTPDPGALFAFRYIPGVEEDEYKTLLAFTGDFLRKELLDQDPVLVEKTKFSFWELADAGLEKVSSIFGTRADIEREYNESGELMAVSFESPLVGFNTPIRRRNSVQID